MVNLLSEWSEDADADQALGMFVKKIAMEVARGGNDHVYTRFKLLS